MRIPKGWDLISTGGNCTAFCRYLLSETDREIGYAMITAADDPSVPTRPTQAVTLGVYLTDRSDPQVQLHVKDTHTAVQITACLITVDGVLLKGWQG